VSGELDLATVDDLAESLDELRRAGWRAVALDLGDVSFMDLTGLRALLKAQEQYRNVGAALVIAGESRAVSRLLDVCDAVPRDLRTREPSCGGPHPSGSPRVGPVHWCGHETPDE
jgi:anti-anti-sigma factor